ncbi:MAG: hypothetical protein P0Y48_09945 [Candidatus Microbacterium phytovorans]|uniref:Uncharacterized protein n=1 Tax=Candidatus Microbacterium phytovorans TaxID=3121374 RepID=A0AAJ6B373_9MICO|nr:hypothetical protein [Microbacterium sp.]WEK12787.1 MAG: hypothetical protein P0Y48_09945 [Microbacterium sp.]
MAEFDVRNPSQVSSPTHLDVDLGIAGRRLIVASGICCPDWRVDTDDVTRRTDIVHLRIPADRIEKASTHVALASIANEDTGYAFGVDRASVTVNGQTGELDLAVDLAVMGESSSLNRFSYQVVATVVRDVAEVTGTIRWPRTMLDLASPDPLAAADHVRVTLHERRTTPADGPFGGENEHLTPLVAGEIVDATLDSDRWAVRYRILNPPRGRSLKVTIFPTGFTVPAEADLTYGPVAPGTETFTLQPPDTNRRGVDFAVGFRVLR